MRVYVHTTVDDQTQAEKATDQLLEAGFASRDIDIIECSHRRARHVQLSPRSYALRVGLFGAAVGAIIGSLAFTQPSLWISQLPHMGISAAAGLGALFGLVAGGLAGAGYPRSVPKLEAAPTSIVVGVHTDRARVDSATQALQKAGARRVETGTAPHAIRRLSGARA